MLASSYRPYSAVTVRWKYNWNETRGQWSVKREREYFELVMG
jgi:hypothetical protein